MITSTGALTKDLIADTSLWRLIVRIGSEPSVRAMLVGPESVERSILVHADTPADSSVRALENVIYDNSLLLADFASVDVIFASPEFMAAPASVADLNEPMFQAMMPDFTAPRHIKAEPIVGTDINVVYGVDADLYHFVARTFAAASFHHSMAVNATYLYHRNQARGGASAHVYALCGKDDELSLVTIDAAGRPAAMVRRRARTEADHAYFILAAAAEAANAPISVGGEPDLRNGVCELLRKMRPDVSVLPLTLPDDLLTMRRLAPEATFDMIFLTQL